MCLHNMAFTKYSGGLLFFFLRQPNSVTALFRCVTGTSSRGALHPHITNSAGWIPQKLNYGTIPSPKRTR